MADQPATILWDEVPEPVSPEAPLEGLETKVLQVWSENSPSLRKAHQNPASQNQVENAVRLAVHGALLEELTLKSQGMTPEDARELTRPAMWTPPTWPTMTPSTTPAPKAAVAKLGPSYGRSVQGQPGQEEGEPMQTPLSQSAIKTSWTAQNPALVQELEADGALDGRLTEAHELVSPVMADAISRGVEPGSGERTRPGRDRSDRGDGVDASREVEPAGVATDDTVYP